MSVATISTQENITGYPYVSLKSLSDGPKNNSTGVPYLYMTTMDVSGHDLEVSHYKNISMCNGLSLVSLKILVAIKLQLYLDYLFFYAKV